jgi:hypothetical protein
MKVVSSEALTFHYWALLFSVTHLKNKRTNKEELLFLLFDNNRGKENVIFYIITLVVIVMNKNDNLKNVKISF